MNSLLSYSHSKQINISHKWWSNMKNRKKNLLPSLRVRTPFRRFHFPMRTVEKNYVVSSLNLTHFSHKMWLTVAVDFFFVSKRSPKIFLGHKNYFIALVQTSVKIIRCAQHWSICLRLKSSSPWTDKCVFPSCLCSWNSCVTHLKFRDQCLKHIAVIEINYSRSISLESSETIPTLPCQQQLFRWRVKYWIRNLTMYYLVRDNNEANSINV